VIAALLFLGLLAGILAAIVLLARSAQGTLRHRKSPRAPGKSALSSDDVYAPLLMHSTWPAASDPAPSSSSHDSSPAPASGPDCSCSGDSGSSCDGGGGGGSCGGD